MIEKLMKAVKRGNKKRGVNITIGAVIGMLLSCTVAMGADEFGAKIEANNPGYDFLNSTNVSTFTFDGSAYGIYMNSSTIRDIINSGNVEATTMDSSSNAYGIYLNSSEMRDILNYKTVKGKNSGIYLSSLKMRDIINVGDINSSISDSSSSAISGSGIHLNNSSMGVIINTGNIVSSTSNLSSEIFFSSGISSGIYLDSSVMEDVINIGNISTIGTSMGIASPGTGIGVNVENVLKMRNIINIGNINATGISNSNGIGSGYGIKLLDVILNTGDIENSGNINVIGTGTGAATYGISLLNTTLEAGDIINSGNINAASTSTAINNISNSFGIWLSEAILKDGNIINAGNINVISTSGYSGDGFGIYLLNTTLEAGNIINTGNINAMGNGENTSSGYGMYIESSTVENIINTGIISGKFSKTGNAYGVYSLSNLPININNSGVIYGTGNALSLIGNEKVNNYGILAAKGNDVISSSTGENYGLYIAGSTGIVTKENGSFSGAIIMGYDENGHEIKRNMTIRNADIKAGGTSTESFRFSAGENYDNSILNGKNDTLSVSGAGRGINGTVINAYETAVKFANGGGELTLSGTIVNGGIDGASNTISGSSAADTLILQSGEAGQNTVINGNINMGAGNDILTIGTGTIINVTLNGGTGSDTLNFGISSKTRANTADEINIRHNISDFENMNINTNVTLFETTTDSSGNSIGLTVTDEENITIGKDGVLTLRININDIDNSSGTDKIKGHALYKNDGTIYSTDGGKLLLALNGAGNNSIISFEDTQLDSSLVTGNEAVYQEDVTFGTTSLLHSVKRVDGTNNEVEVTALNNLPLYNSTHGYEKLNEIYQSILSVDELGNFNVTTNENFSSLLGYLNDIYAGNPYSYSSELSRKSMGMFRDIIAENQFKADTGKWLIYGGLTHVDGGNKDTYYGKGYYTYDIGSSDIEADTKITGAYILGEYGVSDTLTSGVIVGGNKLKSDLSNGSKVDGDALYIGGYVKKYAGNLKVTAGAGLQYGDYDIDRAAAGKGITETRNYSSNYNDMSYDIYLNGRYSNPIGDNLYLEPYGTLSYTYIKQDSTDEGNKTLAIETDSKSFDYTSAKVGVDLKKVISHEKGKSTLSAGVSYTRLLNGADEEYFTGRFKGGKDFDILVAHKNEHSIGLNAKYALELENGVLFDVKGTYSVERDSNNNSGKNKSKGEWIVGAGLGYKF